MACYRRLIIPFTPFLTFLLVFFGAEVAQATHLRAGEITVERVGCGNTYRITVTVYTNTRNTTVLFGGDQDQIDFGDGSPIQFVPTTQNTPRPDLDPDGAVATASYSVIHVYAGPGRYRISYREPNRNEGVLNMDASINTTFYLETVIDIDPTIGCDNSPRLLVEPIDRACPGVAWSHNPGAYDPDGDSLSYELVVPFSDRGTPVINYKAPNDPKFYANFGSGNETGTGPPTFRIDPVTGTITWDAPSPTAIGEYNIAFHIVQWRKVFGRWANIGYVRRDMQILVDDCDNDRPDLIIPNDTCVVAGTKLEASIFGIDPDNDDVKIEAFSEILEFPQDSAYYIPVPGVSDYRPSNPPAETKFTWQTTCAHVKSLPYQVVFKITDNPPNGARLVTFKTWFITVVGPPPQWTSASLSGNRAADLTWESYECQNAERIEIWRKVDGSPFVPENCQTGMPDYLGYELIGTKSVSETTFSDNNGGRGLAPGAKYCYRLVAIFPQPRGGESYVSEDICEGPILADVPIITHVSVERTANPDGNIRVSWRSPFDADPAQFPPPYEYDVYRGDGFARGNDSILVVNGLSDTTFLDTNLNTTENVYNYSIAAYASNGAFVGTSTFASSVRLSARSQVSQIELTWAATVPWSNVIQTFPNKHLIYRGPEGATENNLELIDSVDVRSDGLVYVDRGQYQNTPLDNNTIYCYRIMTRGGYGNPLIAQPLVNFSQIICAQPGDSIPPCKLLPPVRDSAQYADCEDYFNDICIPESFENVITWEAPEDLDCRRDIAYYNIYRAGKKGDPFILVGDTTATTFVDRNLTSFARCYKISAVDRNGNESELSEELCIDNCPYYELPNVFTPNSDGYNDEFSAYNIREYTICGGEECPGIPAPPIELKLKCARFVEEVHFRVFNRWGREVYTYTGSSNNDVNNIYIDWDGRDNDGADLSPAVYYYVAEVTFDLVDPNSRVKTYKGWVQIIR